MGFGDDLRQAEMNVRMACASYEQTQKEAEDAVRRAEKARDARIRDIEKNMGSVKKEAARRVASFKNIFLYVDRVVCAGSRLGFDEALVATVDVRGGIYPGGRFGAPRDHRRLFVLIESPAGTILRECDPNEEKKARDFVALVNETAASASEVKENACRQLEKLQVELDKEKVDTDEIETAKSALNAVKNDTEVVDAARKALEDLRAQASQEELAAYSDEKARRGRKVLAGAVVLVIGIVFLGIVVIGAIYG